MTNILSLKLFLAITAHGLARLTTSLLYIVVTKHVRLSSLCMYATMSALQAVVAFTVVSRPSEGMCISVFTSSSAADQESPTDTKAGK